MVINKKDTANMQFSRFSLEKYAVLTEHYDTPTKYILFRALVQMEFDASK